MRRDVAAPRGVEVEAARWWHALQVRCMWQDDHGARRETCVEHRAACCGLADGLTMHAITHLIYSEVALKCAEVASQCSEVEIHAHRTASRRLPAGEQGRTIPPVSEAVYAAMEGMLRRERVHCGCEDREGEIKSLNESGRNMSKCRRCGGEMKQGIAMWQTWTGSPDFAAGPVVTLSAGGPGRVIDCSKCSVCGHSVTGVFEK